MDRSLSQKCFLAFQDFIHELTGITIGSDRISMVEGRISKRLRLLELDSYEEYLQLVQNDAQEQKSFIDLITTNETYFFRTPRIWKHIEEEFLPQWHAQNPGKKFTAWSAAASSGEEAHSLGVLCQNFKFSNPSFRYQIVGTDISREMVKSCERGIYSGRSIRAFQQKRPEQFAKYMKAVSDTEFQANEAVKSNLRFYQHNLFEPFKKTTDFDLVLLRNVLIYFTAPDQEAVLALVHRRIKRGGLLVIGESESLTHINTSFEKRQPYIYEPVHAEAVGTGA